MDSGVDPYQVVSEPSILRATTMTRALSGNTGFYNPATMSFPQPVMATSHVSREESFKLYPGDSSGSQPFYQPGNFDPYSMPYMGAYNPFVSHVVSQPSVHTATFPPHTTPMRPPPQQQQYMSPPPPPPPATSDPYRLQQQPSAVPLPQQQQQGPWYPHQNQSQYQYIFGGYSPQPAFGGYLTNWDQSAVAPTQQASQAGYNQQGQGYGRYQAPPQFGYGQPPVCGQHGYHATNYGIVSNPAPDTHTSSQTQLPSSMASAGHHLFSLSLKPQNPVAMAADRATPLKDDFELPDDDTVLKAGEEKEIGKLGLQKKPLKEGQSWETPKSDDEVQVHYSQALSPVTPHNDDIDSDLRPGGMCVQRRDDDTAPARGPSITIDVTHGPVHHVIHLPAHSTLGELKGLVSQKTGLEPEEQKLLFRGKEKDDEDDDVPQITFSGKKKKSLKASKKSGDNSFSAALLEEDASKSKPTGADDEDEDASVITFTGKKQSSKKKGNTAMGEDGEKENVDDSKYKDLAAKVAEMDMMKERFSKLLLGEDTETFASLLETCYKLDAMDYCLRVHRIIPRNLSRKNVGLSSKLLRLYASGGFIEEAHQVFDEMPKRDVSAFAWNSLISGYAELGLYEDAMALYFQMEEEGVEPDRFTFPRVLKACGGIGFVQVGEAVNRHVVRLGFVGDRFVLNALVDMYAKCGDIVKARKVFDKIGNRDKVSWNTMLTAYMRHGLLLQALDIFHQMVREGYQPDSVTISTILTGVSSLELVVQIHGWTIRQGVEWDLSTANSLIAAYSKHGKLKRASWLFCQMPERDVVAWNTIISAHSKSREALLYYEQMESVGALPEAVTFMSVLSAYAHFGAICYLKVVVFTDIRYVKAIEFNDYCHNHQPPIAFIRTKVRGLFGFVFSDFGPEFTVFDVDGEEPHTGIIASISNDNPALGSYVNDERLEFQGEDLVVFSEVHGMTELNDGKPRKIKNVRAYSFTLEEDTSGFGTYEKGGIVTQAKQPKVLNFKPLREALNDPGDFLLSDFSKFDRPTLLHLAFQALDKFVSKLGRFLVAGSEEDAQKLMSVASNINDKLGDGRLDDLNPKLLRHFAFGAKAVLNSMAAMFGGIVGQEIVKACSGKFHPLFQFFYFDSVESLPTEPLDSSELKPLNSHYDAQISVFGSKLQKKLEDAIVFMVGSGALGCELLKNVALMGVSCGDQGKLTINDDDVIEKSNLSRQFPFTVESDNDQLEGSSGECDVD